MTAPSVILAPDKFKGSLTAPDVVRHLALGIGRVADGVSVVPIPVSDGGDGFVDAMVAAGYHQRPVTAEGPTGLPVEASYAVRDEVAVIELAEASGLLRLPGGRMAPLTASSYGTGQVMLAALEAGCHTLVVGLGGSACTDGGVGLLQALGVRVLDADGAEVGRGGAALRAVRSVDLSELAPGLAQATVVVAADVDNPLTGPKGAAAVYGPQKGASPQDVAELDRALANWADVVAARLPAAPAAGAAGAGAAGGMGFGLMALLDAELRPGIDLVLELTGFAHHVRQARLVVTGEGALDAQTLHGKAPAGVAAAARAESVPVIAIAGHSSLSQDETRSLGIAATYTLVEIEPDLQRSMANAGPLLEELGAQLARDWLA